MYVSPKGHRVNWTSSIAYYSGLQLADLIWNTQICNLLLREKWITDFWKLSWTWCLQQPQFWICIYHLHKNIFVKRLTRSTAAEMFACCIVTGIHREFGVCFSQRFSSFMGGRVAFIHSFLLWGYQPHWSHYISLWFLWKKPRNSIKKPLGILFSLVFPMTKPTKTDFSVLIIKLKQGKKLDLILEKGKSRQVQIPDIWSLIWTGEWSDS